MPFFAFGGSALGCADGGPTSVLKALRLSAIGIDKSNFSNRQRAGTFKIIEVKSHLRVPLAV